MAVFFSGSELLEIAVGIERNGMAFYQALADKTGNRDVRDMYDHLAGEEKKHLDTLFGVEVLPRFRTDPRVIGGLVVRVGDRIMDGSVRRRLQGLRRSLLKPETG